MTRRREKRRREAGLTLVETLVAVALVGLLSLVLMEALRFGGRAYIRSVERADTTLARDRAIARLRELVEYAQPSLVLARDNRKLAIFDGAQHGLRLIAPAYLFGGEAGLADAALAVRPLDGGGEALTARWTLIADSATNEPLAAQEIVLAGNVTSVDFRYYGLVEDGKAAEWRGTWREQPALPVLVEMSVTDRDNARWPIILARPRVQQIAE